MKSTLMLLLLATQIGVLFGQNGKTEPYTVKSFSGQSIKEAEAITSGGSISVMGVNASEARVEVFVTSNNGKTLPTDEIKKRMEEMYDLVVSLENGNLVAKAKSKKKITDWKKALNISFTFFIPSTTTTRLTTSGGSISLENLAGSHDFTTSGGSLHVENVSGKIKGRTSGGSIHVKNAKNDIDLTTSGGSIEAKDCEGDIKLSTSGGSLQLKNLSGKIKATTSGGNVSGKDIKGELGAFTSGGSIQLTGIAASLETATSGGNVEVAITELGKYVRIGTSAGHIDLTLPKGKGLDLELEANRIKTSELGNFSGRQDEDHVEGKLNGGGVPVNVKAHSGRITLAFK